MRGTTRVLVTQHTPWVVRSLMHGGCTICTVVSGSGVRIGNEITGGLLPIRAALVPAQTGWLGAAVGTPLQGFAAPQTEAGVRLSTETLIWASE